MHIHVIASSKLAITHGDSLQLFYFTNGLLRMAP